jgi:hypothetical protein
MWEEKIMIAELTLEFTLNHPLALDRSSYPYSHPSAPAILPCKTKPIRLNAKSSQNVPEKGVPTYCRVSTPRETKPIKHNSPRIAASKPLCARRTQFQLRQPCPSLAPFTRPPRRRRDKKAVEKTNPILRMENPT